MGPHPAVADVRRAVRSVLAAQLRDTPADTPQRGQRCVLVACSGGADSVALAAATAFVAPRAGLSAGLVTVDHGLQPGSAAQAARVAALGYELGLDPVEIVPVTVAGGGGLEGAARTARYRALAGAAAALDADILLGHTLDDQAETVLLGLGRGSCPRSIAGMRVRSGRYLRPLLGIRRATTQAACAALGLPVWDDPHNADPRRLRTRLRHEVLPLLEDVLNGGVAQALARTARLLQDDLDALNSWSTSSRSAVTIPAEGGRNSSDQEGPALDVSAVARLPRAVRTRTLRDWVCAATRRTERPVSAERTAALDALVTHRRGQGAVELPGGVTVRRRSGTLVVTRSESSQE